MSGQCGSDDDDDDGLTMTMMTMTAGRDNATTNVSWSGGGQQRICKYSNGGCSNGAASGLMGGSGERGLRR